MKTRALAGNDTQTSDKKTVKDDTNKKVDDKPKPVEEKQIESPPENEEEEKAKATKVVEEPIKTDAVPYIYGVATCGLESVDLHFGKSVMTIDKDFSAAYIVTTDIVCVTIFVLFIFVLQRKQKRFEELYKDYSIQMDDFAVMINNFPHKREYGFSSDKLRLELWDHCFKVIQKEAR